MARSAVRPCLGVPARGIECGQPTRNGRCDEHQLLFERDRHNKAYDDPAWRHASRAAVDAWVRVHGWVCPGYRVAPHPSRDLSADHPLALARGGSLVGQVLGILCPSCNSRKKAAAA